MDCVGGRANDKKLFVQDGLPLIYWWDVFTAMLSSGKAYKTFVCPCRIVDTNLVLVYILKTRCNRPHYDCLVYDIDTDKAFVMRQASKWQSNFQLDPTLQDYDADAMKM
jgi:hypothetical protein